MRSIDFDADPFEPLTGEPPRRIACAALSFGKFEVHDTCQWRFPVARTALASRAIWSLARLLCALHLLVPQPPSPVDKNAPVGCVNRIHLS
jgi:hypothetical protein